MFTTSSFDRYQSGQSLIHQLDPRVKLLTTIAIILSNVFLPDGAWFAFFFTWLGGALAVHYLRTSSTTIIMMCLYWIAAKVQERKFENSPLAGEYRIYKSTTGMFLPSLKLFRL